MVKTRTEEWIGVFSKAFRYAHTKHTSLAKQKMKSVRCPRVSFSVTRAEVRPTNRVIIVVPEDSRDV